MQQSLSDERRGKQSAELRAAGVLEAVKQGVAVDSIDYVLTLADCDGCTDADGKILSDKLSEAIKKVLERVPAFKKQTETAGGVHRVGGDGNSEGQPQSTAKVVPQKKWNRFNL